MMDRVIHVYFEFKYGEGGLYANNSVQHRGLYTSKYGNISVTLVYINSPDPFTISSAEKSWNLSQLLTLIYVCIRCF